MLPRTWYIIAGAVLWVVADGFVDNDAVFWSCYTAAVGFFVLWLIAVVKEKPSDEQ